jgi:hypothetical protein
MANSTPALPILTLTNDDGVSVNESALCVLCLQDEDEREYARRNWLDADDVTIYDYDVFTPADNEDAFCHACGATQEPEYIS